MSRTPSCRRLLACSALVGLAWLAACGEPVETAEVDASEISGAPLFQPTEEEPTKPPVQAEPAEPTDPVPSVEPESPAADETTQDPAAGAVEDAPEAGTEIPEPEVEQPVAADEGPDVEPAPESGDEPADPVVEEPTDEEPVAGAETEATDAAEPEMGDVVVGDIGNPEDQPEPDKGDAAEQGEATILTFDELASFIWIPPALPSDDPTKLGPPDPNADAGGVATGTDQTPTSADHPTPTGQKSSEVPATIKAHAGKRVAVEGYMIPLEFDEEGGVRRFLLSRYMMGCCFGVVPQPNELVLVTMVNEEGAVYEPYLTVLATGKFDVHDDGEQLGTLRTLYSVAGENCRFILDR